MALVTKWVVAAIATSRHPSLTKETTTLLCADGSDTSVKPVLYGHPEVYETYEEALARAERCGELGVSFWTYRPATVVYDDAT